MALKTIGVVIPTFERPHETARAVESVLNQTLTPDKIVVVDDGSKESDFNLLECLLDGLKVTLLRQNHSGHPGIVRNAGCRALSTDYVAFLDSDDIWLENKLEVQMCFVEAGHHAMFTNASRRREDSATPLIPLRDFPTSLNLKALLRSNMICNSSVLLSMPLLFRIGGIPECYAVRGLEDYAAWLRVASFVNWAGTPQELVNYSDTPETSIRGARNCEIPEQALAHLDFISWRSGIDQPIFGTRYIVSNLLPRFTRHFARRLKVSSLSNSTPVAKRNRF